MSVERIPWRGAMALLWLLASAPAWGKLMAQQPAAGRPSQPFDPAGIHVMEFTDDSVLHGTIKAIGPDALTVFRTDASAPMAFPLSTVHRLLLDGEPDAEAPPRRCTVQLVTGDWLVAEVLLVKEGKVELRLAHAQRITLETRWIDWICFANGPAPDVFHGPESLEGWTSNGVWTCEDRALHCQQLGNLQRTFQVVPDRIDLQFDMEKGEVQKNFMMAFNFRRATPSGETASNAWTQIRLNEGQLYIYAACDSKQLNNSSIALPRIATKPNAAGKFRYHLLMDRVVGRIIVTINDFPVADQAIPAMPEGTWSGALTFQPMRWGSDSDWTLSQIHMLPWDGQTPTESSSGAPPQLDLLTLADGTIQRGRLESVLGNAVKFRSAAGRADLARERISMLRWHRAQPAADLPVATGPRLTLADRGELKLATLTLAEQTLTLGTTFGGQIPLPVKAAYALTYPHEEMNAFPPADRLVFRNGDQVRGTLLAAGHAAPLRWEFPAGGSVDFQTKRVGGVLLAARPHMPVGPGDCVVRFRNGDWLGGQLVALDPASLRLRSHFGNEFSIPRPQLQTLYLSKPGQAAIWEGGTQPEAWWKGAMATNGYYSEDAVNRHDQPTPRHKVYLDGAFFLPGNAGKQVSLGKSLDGLPERVEITFETASAQKGQGFSTQLFYESSGPLNGLQMKVYNDGLMVQDFTPKDRKARGGNNEPQRAQWADKVDREARRHRFRILADRRLHQATFIVDDVTMLVVKSRNKEDVAPWGYGLAFNTDGSSASSLILQRLWVAPWNGQLPNALPNAATESVALANGDEAKAAIKSGTPTGFTLDFEGEELEIPREKVLLADFGPAATASEPKLSLTEHAPLRLRLVQGGALTVETLALANGQVTCASASFGQLHVPLGTFTEIIWSGLDRDIQFLQPTPITPDRKRPK